MSIKKSACPDWASELIEQLLQVEILLGNLPPNTEWKSQGVSKFLSENPSLIREDHAEFLFGKIVKKLRSDGFSNDEILTFINERIFLQNGPAYCDLDQVKAVSR